MENSARLESLRTTFCECSREWREARRDRADTTALSWRPGYARSRNQKTNGSALDCRERWKFPGPPERQKSWPTSANCSAIGARNFSNLSLPERTAWSKDKQRSADRVPLQCDCRSPTQKKLRRWSASDRQAQNITPRSRPETRDRARLARRHQIRRCTKSRFQKLERAKAESVSATILCPRSTSETETKLTRQKPEQPTRVPGNSWSGGFFVGQRLAACSKPRPTGKPNNTGHFAGPFHSTTTARVFAGRHDLRARRSRFARCNRSAPAWPWSKNRKGGALPARVRSQSTSLDLCSPADPLGPF